MPRAFTDYVSEEVCTVTMSPVCRPVPANRCQDVQEAVSTLVPKQHCYTQPKEVCQQVANQVCNQVPVQECTQVPRYTSKLNIIYFQYYNLISQVCLCQCTP